MQCPPTEHELTVVVPVFNRTEALRRAIGSILSQVPSVPVIVVDDGSSPQYGAVVDEIAANRGGLVRVVHQPNRGPAAARNAGLQFATSPFVMFLDSDDELAEGASAVIDRFLVRSEEVGLLCGAVRVVSPDGASRMDEPAVTSTVPSAKLSRLAGSFAVRTDVAQAIGGYDEALRCGENTDFILRLADECRRRSLRVAATTDELAIYHAPVDGRRYDAQRLDAAIHLLRRDRFDRQAPSERARLHAIAAVNAARVRRYGLSVKHGALAALVEPRNPRHLVRLAFCFSGPLARRRWLSP